MTSLTFLALTACSFDEGGLSSNDGGAADAMNGVDGSAQIADASSIDSAPTDASCQTGITLPFDASNIDECQLTNPQSPFDPGPGSWIINTDTLTITNSATMNTQALDATVVSQAGGPELIVVAGTSVTIGATTVVAVVGPRPILFLSTGDATVAGKIYVGASWQLGGPGANDPVLCSAGTGVPGTQQSTVPGPTGGGGGGGGAFGSVGGQGAAVDQATVPANASGGTANGSDLIIPLRGGCKGGAGGNSGGGGGGGGGGLQIVASGLATISGQLIARGGGGRGATSPSAGGGGGGSGGAILVEASRIMVTGSITANGGGGGEGTFSAAVDFLGVDGGNGSNTDAQGGTGGSGGTTFGGDGGNGGSSSQAAAEGFVGSGTDTMLAAGGGGGGGGVGRIRLNVVDTITIDPLAVISPAHTANN